MLGFAQPPVPTQAAPPAPAPAAVGAMHKTMLGLAATPPASPLARGQDSPAANSERVNAPPAGAAPAKAPPAANRTMLGVAMPGIAPLRPGEAAAGPRPKPEPAQAPASRQAQGAAPPLTSTIAIVPAPAPLADLPEPIAPRIIKKKGISLVVVALVTGVLVLIGGGTTALLWRSAPPISAQPRTSPEGRDYVHLTCDPASCKDGTTVEYQGAKSSFAAGECDLHLTETLRVGDNPLALHIDRPGFGRDEILNLVVPVAYRVHADIAAMSSAHPSILIHAQAVPGSTVRVDGKDIPLDSTGSGTYAIDEAVAAEGPADESKVVSADVPYVVTSKAGTQSGTVSARVAIAPLRVDAPGTQGVVEEDHVLIAGRAAKGASITVDGAPVPVGADGAFESTVGLVAMGDRVIDVRGGTAALTPRTVHVTVKRVPSLTDEARAFEAQNTIGYDSALADLAGSSGRPIVVEGEVFDSRGSAHRTLMLVDDRRGCRRGPCIARVIVGRDLAVARGESVRAYGRVARGFATASGQTVPEVEADFVLRAKR
jgi:hypothetical protein